MRAPNNAPPNDSETGELLDVVRRVATTIEALPSILAAVRNGEPEAPAKSPLAVRITAAATVGMLAIALILAGPTLAKMVRKVGPVLWESAHKLLIALSESDSMPPKEVPQRNPDSDTRPPVLTVPEPASQPSATEQRRTPREAPTHGKQRESSNRLPERQVVPLRQSAATLARVEFIEVGGVAALERLLGDRPESKKLFDCFWQNQFVYGLSLEPQTFFVPARGTLSAREFSLLANDCAGLALREIHVPAEWQPRYLDEHLAQWSAGCQVKPEYIDRWSRVRVEETGDNVSRCGPGGTCLVVTTLTSCDARTFRHFNLARSIARTSR